MKHLLTAVLSLTVLLLGFAVAPASAHVLKTDGTIGAVLHIDPDDNPVTGKSTSYVLAFKDTAGQFTLPKCDCGATIQENGKTINTSPLQTLDSSDGQGSFTFSKPDVYNLVISGTAKDGKSFQPFTLTYLLRVEAGAGETSSGARTQPFPPLLWIGIGLVIGLLMLAGYASERERTISKT
jgi:hypothetical protein